jgi:regulatory factor X
MFGGNPEDMLMRFGHQFSHHSNSPSLDQSMHDHNAMPRADEFQNHAMHDQNLAHQPIQPPMPHAIHAIPQYQPIYDSGAENHLPDHITEDQEMSEQGTKKKRGASSTLANDMELRKLLRQYEGWTLKQMAAEVMKHEGGGGKAEKVKQVFAMIW